MIHIWLEGLALGFGAVLPIGPINILIIHYALRSLRDGIVFGLGAMSADLLYLGLILAGFSPLADQPLILQGLGIFGSGFLLFTAWGLFTKRHAPLDATPTSSKSVTHLYLRGLALTLLNPYTVAFWLSVASFASSAPFWLSFGIACALLCWVVFLTLLIHHTKHHLSPRTISLLTLCGALLIGGFGIVLGVKTVDGW